MSEVKLTSGNYIDKGNDFAGYLPTDINKNEVIVAETIENNVRRSIIVSLHKDIITQIRM